MAATSSAGEPRALKRRIMLWLVRAASNRITSALERSIRTSMQNYSEPRREVSWSSPIVQLRSPPADILPTVAEETGETDGTIFQGLRFPDDDQDWEDPRLFGFIQDTPDYLGITEPNHDTDFEDHTMIEISSDFPEIPAEEQVEQTDDADFEDPAWFDLISDSSEHINTYGDSPEDNTDSEFEGGLFDYIWEQTEESNTVQPELSTTASHQDSNEDHIEKHLWPCVVCLNKPPETLFVPCFHAACCQDCADHVKNRGGCPVCSSTIDHVDRVYFTQNTCVVCMDKPPQSVFKPCCHAVCCDDCSSKIQYGGEEDDSIESKCPVCKADIEETDIFHLAYS